MYISNAYSADFVNIIYNMLIGIASAIPIIFVLKDFLIENWKIFKDKFLENLEQLFFKSSGNVNFFKVMF